MATKKPKEAVKSAKLTPAEEMKEFERREAITQKKIAKIVQEDIAKAKAQLAAK